MWAGNGRSAFNMLVIEEQEAGHVGERCTRCGRPWRSRSTAAYGSENGGEAGAAQCRAVSSPYAPRRFSAAC